MKPEKVTIKMIEKAISVPVSEWKGNCFAVASQIVKAKLVDGHAVFGMWIGPIHRESFFKNRANIGFTQHGWIVLKDERVFDPTRWVFENVKPYIYIGEHLESLVCQCGHVVEEHNNGFFKECECCECIGYESADELWPYDEGANKVNRLCRPAAPPFVAKDKVSIKFSGPAQLIVARLLGCDAPYSKGQIMWLANTPYDELVYIAEIYGAIKKAGYAAFIPLDNKLKAERQGFLQ